MKQKTLSAQREKQKHHKKECITSLTAQQAKVYRIVFEFNLQASGWGLIRNGWKILHQRGHLEAFLTQYLGLTPFKQLLQKQAYPDFRALLESFPAKYPFLIVQHHHYALLAEVLSDLFAEPETPELSSTQQGLFQVLDALVQTQPVSVGHCLLEKLAPYHGTHPNIVQAIQNYLSAEHGITARKTNFSLPATSSLSAEVLSQPSPRFAPLPVQEQVSGIAYTGSFFAAKSMPSSETTMHAVSSPLEEDCKLTSSL